MGIWRIPGIVILFAAAAVFGVAASMVSVEMVNAVNRRLPAESQFGMLMWHTEKTLRLRREYRRLYPDGGLVRRSDGLAAGMFLCWGLAVALLFRWI